MDAKAEDTVAAGAGEASEAEDQKPTTETGKAVDTLERRLTAGFEGDASQEAADLDKKPPAETDESDGLDKSDKSDGSDEGAEDEIKEGEVEGLSVKAQAKINERIHELNIKRKNAESEAEQTKARLKDLEVKIQDEHVLAVMKLGLDPEYVTPEEAKTLNRFENLREWKKWLRTHRDGYEGSDPKESMTPQQVAEREALVEDELLDVAGPARTLWLERTKLMREDMAAGRKARLEKASKPKPKTPDPKPPKLPETNGATRKPPVSAGSKGKAAFDSKEFQAAGGDKDALEKQFEKIFGG
ncbi:MAG: hypothetical protein WC359_12565 [Dehalococcoidia bacterium]|jgi:hypothetical protein